MRTFQPRERPPKNHFLFDVASRPQAHGGDATLLLLDVDHQAARPASSLIQACLFLYDRLGVEGGETDRAAYAARLDTLAAQGHLGATGAAPEASGLSRDRQRAVEQEVAAKVTGRFKTSFFG